MADNQQPQEALAVPDDVQQQATEEVCFVYNQFPAQKKRRAPNEPPRKRGRPRKNADSAPAASEGVPDVTAHMNRLKDIANKPGIQAAVKRGYKKKVEQYGPEGELIGEQPEQYDPIYVSPDCTLYTNGKQFSSRTGVFRVVNKRSQHTCVHCATETPLDGRKAKGFRRNKCDHCRGPLLGWNNLLPQYTLPENDPKVKKNKVPAEKKNDENRDGGDENEEDQLPGSRFINEDDSDGDDHGHKDGDLQENPNDRATADDGEGAPSKKKQGVVKVVGRTEMTTNSNPGTVLCVECYRYRVENGPDSLQRRRCIQCLCPANLAKISWGDGYFLMCIDCVMAPTTAVNCMRCTVDLPLLTASTTQTFGGTHVRLFHTQGIKVCGKPGWRVCRDCAVVENPDVVPKEKADVDVCETCTFCGLGRSVAAGWNWHKVPSEDGNPEHEMRLCKVCKLEHMKWMNSGPSEPPGKRPCRICKAGHRKTFLVAKNQLKDASMSLFPGGHYCSQCLNSLSKLFAMGPSQIDITREATFNINNGDVTSAPPEDFTGRCSHCEARYASMHHKRAYRVPGTTPPSYVCYNCHTWRKGGKTLEEYVCQTCGKAKDVLLRRQFERSSESEEVVCGECREREKKELKCQYCSRPLDGLKRAAVPYNAGGVRMGKDRWCMPCMGWWTKYSSMANRVCCKCGGTDMVMGARLGNDRSLYCRNCMPMSIRKMIKQDSRRTTEPRCDKCLQHLPPGHTSSDTLKKKRKKAKAADGGHNEEVPMQEEGEDDPEGKVAQALLTLN